MTTLLGSPVALTAGTGNDVAGTLTPTAGNSRAALIYASFKTDGAYTVGTKPVFTVGGFTIPAADVYVATDTVTNAARRIAVAVLKEGDFPTSAETVTVTLASASGAYDGSYQLYEDVGSVRDSDADTTNNSNDQVLSLAGLVVGDYVAIAGSSDTTTGTTVTGYTSSTNFGSQRTDVFEKEVTTAGTETITVVFDAAASRSGSVALALITAAATETDAPTADSTPALDNTTKRYPRIAVDYTDAVTANVLHYGVVLDAAAAAPTVAQVKLGHDSTDTDVGTGKKDTLTLVSGVLGHLEYPEAGTGAQKSYSFAEDENGNESALVTIDIPAQGVAVIDEDAPLSNLITASVNGLNWTVGTGAITANAWKDDVLEIRRAANENDTCLFRVVSISDVGVVVAENMKGITFVPAVNDVVIRHPSASEVAVGALSTAAVTAVQAGLATEANLTSVKAKTDELSINAGAVQSNLTHVLGVQQVGTGGPGDNIRPTGQAPS